MAGASLVEATTLDQGTVASLDAPTSISVFDKTVFVGSQSTTQNDLLAFDFTADLTHTPTSDVTFDDGNVAATPTGVCAAAHAADSYYCLANDGSASGGSVWLVGPSGAAPAIDGLKNPGSIAVLANGDHLYVTTDDGLQAYWIRGDTAGSPGRLVTYDLGAAAHTVVSAMQDTMVYASYPSLDTILVIDTATLDEDSRITDFAAPSTMTVRVHAGM